MSSTNSFKPRMRGHAAQSKFSDAAKAAKAASTRTNFKRPEGAFDRLVLGDKPIWLRLHPDQLYAQMLYDRALKQLIETGTEDYPARPWFESASHFVVARKRSFQCSAGAARDQACRGCSIRAMFYDKLREQEKATSVKDEEKRKHPPIQASTRYAMSATVLEKIFELPLMKDGKVRKSRQGQDLTHFVPAPLSGVPLLKQKDMGGTFGHNFHWGFGAVHLAQLAEIDQDLWNVCANCANELMTTEVHCTECDAVIFQDANGVTGIDLRNLREQPIRCESCGHEGPGAPVLTCTGCEKPAEGSIMAFDLRLRSVKIEDKKYDLKLEDYRLPDYASLFDAPTAERIYELIMSPLDIPAIYAPDSIDSQAWSLPDDLKAIDPHYHLKKKESQPYGQEDEGDADQMSFDEGGAES